MDFYSYTHYIFDFDGTLFDTAPDVLHCLKKTLRHYGYSAAGVNASLLGPVLEKILEGLCSGSTEADRARMVEHFRRSYRQCGFLRTQPFPGIPRLLARLQNEGKRLYIATNKPQHLTLAILKVKELSRAFTDVVCCDSGKPAMKKSEMLSFLQDKFAFAPTEGIMVGDTPEDIRSGKNAGMSTCAACYGYGSTEELLAEQPNFAVCADDWLNIEAIHTYSP